MTTMTQHEYSLEIIKKIPESIVEYTKLMMVVVDEIDKRPIRDEIKKIQSQYHVDHYFIKQDDQKIGTVKITHGTFYSLGVKDDIPEKDFKTIISTIEEHLGGFRVNQLEATLHDKFLPVAQDMGYTVEFSRKKMELEIEKAENLRDPGDIISRTYKDGDLSNLIDMYVDAYRDSVDEQIGMFGGNIASSAISSILRGNFGEFRPKLSPLIVRDGDYIEGASLTTISENCPFVVIIGVRREKQGKGYGKKLLSWVINKVKEEGYDRIRLWVTVENEKALELYNSVGFIEISRIHSLVRKL